MLSVIVTKLYIRSSDLIHCMIENLYPFTSSPYSYIPHSLALGNHVFVVVVLGFFEGHIFKIFSFQQFDHYMSKKLYCFYIVNITFTRFSSFLELRVNIFHEFEIFLAIVSSLFPSLLFFLFPSGTPVRPMVPFDSVLHVSGSSLHFQLLLLSLLYFRYFSIVLSFSSSA